MLLVDALSEVIGAVVFLIAAFLLLGRIRNRSSATARSLSS
jgi:hypothetical protein